MTGLEPGHIIVHFAEARQSRLRIADLRVVGTTVEMEAILPFLRHRIVIGKDTRLSGYMLENALSSGILSMGVDVLFIGPLPTPGVAYVTRSLRADAGIVITASHNPYDDNGIKFFRADGYKLDDKIEAQIEHLVFSGEIENIRPTASAIGKAAATTPTSAA